MKKKTTPETQSNEFFANLIRSKRKELGLNQTEVARSLGLTQEAFSRKETGRRKISLTEFVRFAKTYAPDIMKFFVAPLLILRYIMLTFISLP